MESEDIIKVLFELRNTLMYCTASSRSGLPGFTIFSSWSWRLAGILTGSVILTAVSGKMPLVGRKMGGCFGIFEERFLHGALIG